MAKKSMLMRQRHREQAVKRYAEKRAELKELIRNPKTSDDDKAEAQKKLQTAAARRESRFGCATAAR